MIPQYEEQRFSGKFVGEFYRLAVESDAQGDLQELCPRRLPHRLLELLNDRANHGLSFHQLAPPRAG